MNGYCNKFEELWECLCLTYKKLNPNRTPYDENQKKEIFLMGIKDNSYEYVKHDCRCFEWTFQEIVTDL